MSVSPDSDVVDHLAGVEPGSSLHQIRARRAQARENAQKSYLALFQPSDFGTRTLGGRSLCGSSAPRANCRRVVRVQAQVVRT